MSTCIDEDSNERNEPVIVDCDVLEAAKENIQPLAKGRRVTTLAGILATPHVHRESRLAATRNRLRMNVQLALENSVSNDDEDDDDMEDTDPLDAYCQYVYWVVENYPQGHSAESGLLELLEEATRVLKDHQGGKWRGDLRYLKLWVLYASYVEKPAIIFKFCMVNEIGTAHSLLYEEFAIALERAGRKTQADETYRVGIARKAQPLERLELKYREFQKRMMSSPVLPSQPDPEDGAAPTVQPAPKRKALAETKSASRPTSRTTRSSSRLASSSSPASTPTLPQTARPQPNARLQVYVDPSPEDAASGALNEEEAPSAWPELGTRKSRVKENIKEATKAAGTTLRQPGKAQRAAAARRTPKIDVYRDALPDESEIPADTGIATEPEEASPTPPPPPPPSSSKSKLSSKIEVFCDEVDDASSAPAPSVSRTTTSKKSVIPVFRDAPLAASSSATAAPARAPKARTASKSSIPVFRDEPTPEPAPKLAKGKAKSTIPVFRDELAADTENDPAPKPAAGSLKGKGKIPVFRDEAAAAPKAKIPVFRDPEPAPTKPKFAVFRDDAQDAQEPAAAKSKGKGKIDVFCDDDAGTFSGPSKPKSKIDVFRDADAEHDGPAKAKSKIAVFRDEDGAAEPAVEPPKNKGKFPVFRDDDAHEPAPQKTKSKITVFRDEEEPASPTKPSAAALGRTRSGTGVGLGISGLGAGSSSAGTEAEALRRDPLKNYTEDEKVDLD